MTLPIGTAEERELIGALRKEAETHQMFSSAIVDGRASLYWKAATALQSRIAEVEALSERVRVLEEAGNALVAKLDECEPHIITTFMEGPHGCPSRAPQYCDELNAFRASLTQGGE